MASQGPSKAWGYEQSTGSCTTRLVIESGISLRPDDGRELAEVGEEFGLRRKLSLRPP